MILIEAKPKKKKGSPPEKLVKALKKNPKVDNPWALANYIKGKKKEDECEANAANALAPVERGGKKRESAKGFRESIEVLSNVDPLTQLEGPKMKVVLITEGLGNRVNMNYYGPEAIDTAPQIFEGKPAYFDHPTDSEDREIPERRVVSKVGYFKNCQVETIAGARACTGEIHFDLSEGGKQAHLKALTALHYKAEFPSLDSEYVGLSINASGDFEKRTMKWEGETVEVNYVTRFTGAVSCDIVTQPARGGRFLALVESAAGASTKQKKEDEQMKERLKKSLEAARSALKDAVKESDPEKAKKKLAESDKLFDAFFKEAMQSAGPGEESEESKGEESADGSGEEAGAQEAKKKETKKGKEDDEMEADDGDGEQDGDDDDVKDAKKKKEKKEKKESNIFVIKAMAKEAKLELDNHTIDKLSNLSLGEAKAEIASLKTFKESIVKQVVKAMELPAANFEKLTESERSEVGSKNNDLFANCVR